MKTIIVKDNTFVCEETQKPILKEKGAIVKILGCGLCGSDLVKLSNGKFKNGDVPGHEIVGVIEEINSSTGFKVGDKITAGHHVPCGECRYCKGKNFSMCEKFKSTNFVPGGFAEYIFLSEEHLKHTTFRIPEHLKEEKFSFTEPGACCLRAVKRMNLRSKSDVLVIGLGSIGILTGEILNALGYNAYGCDILDERLILAENFKFKKLYKTDNPEKFIEEFKSDGIKEGFDGIMMTSGAESALELASRAIRNGGIINVFSSVKSDLAAYWNNEIYYRELSVIGSYSSSPKELAEAFQMISDGTIKVDGLYSVYDFSKIQTALDDIKAKKTVKAYLKP